MGYGNSTKDIGIKLAVASTAGAFVLKAFGEPFLHPLLYRFAAVLGIAIGAALVILDLIFVWPFYRSPLRHLPTAKDGVLYDLSIIAERPRGTTPLKWFKQHPGADVIQFFGVGNDPRLFPVSPDALRDVMATHSYDYVKPWGIRAFLARVIGFGLILSEGDVHRKQRKTLTPAFNIRNIRALYSLMWEKTGILLEELAKEHKEQGFIEMASWGSKLTLDIIGPAALSRDFDSMRSSDHRIADAFLAILEPDLWLAIFMICNFFIPQWIMTRVPAKANRVIKVHCKFLRDTCRQVLDEKKEVYRTEKAHDENDIMTNIIASQQFTDDEIIDQMLTFLAAGHETTASALTWCSYLLARMPKVQEKLRKEIRENIPKPGAAPVNYQMFENLPYLNGVCEEVLRLFPTVPATIREAVRDTQMAGVKVPESTQVVLVPYAINRNPHFWGEDAADMKPERWIDTAPDGTRRPNKHGGASSNFNEITFLHGNRACIGRDFAKAELRCAVAGVFGRYEVEMVDPLENVVIAGTVTTKPENGMRLKLTAIDGW